MGGQAPQPAARGQKQTNPFIHDVNERTRGNRYRVKLYGADPGGSRMIGIMEKARGSGGARRDRTDDLKLAKLALSQLSYGPVRYQSSEVSNQDEIFTDP